MLTKTIGQTTRADCCPATLDVTTATRESQAPRANRG
jgi:hypothetical protein